MLHYQAPAGVLTPELRAALVEHKGELLALLEAEGDRPANDPPATAPDPSEAAPWYPTPAGAACKARIDRMVADLGSLPAPRALTTEETARHETLYSAVNEAALRRDPAAVDRLAGDYATFWRAISADDRG